MRVLSRKTSLAACALTVAALTGAPAQASTTSGQAAAGSAKGVPAAAPPARSANWGTPCGPPFVQDDKLLGPLVLPHTSPLSEILAGYRRYGGLIPADFLRRYLNPATNFYRFPPDSGFAHADGFSNARVLVTQVKLPIGYKVDRFGGETGAFLAPYGTPFPARALPPSNLNNAPGDPHLCNYHVYRVIRPFYVDGGPAAPAFQQPGQGEQFHTIARYIPGAPANPDGEVSIGWLVGNGYLLPLN